MFERTSYICGQATMGTVSENRRPSSHGKSGNYGRTRGFEGPGKYGICSENGRPS